MELRVVSEERSHRLMLKLWYRTVKRRNSLECGQYGVRVDEVVGKFWVYPGNPF